MLCRLALMDQAAVLDGLCFDLLPFCQDCRAAPEVVRPEQRFHAAGSR